MKAIKAVGNSKAEIQNVPLPTIRDNYILVKVRAVALNPTDWKHVDYLAAPGTTIGCDVAGIIVDVGSKVDSYWKKGDRIAGFSHGGNQTQPEDGAFAEYCLLRAGVGMKIPDNISFEDACTFGVAITTVGQGLYQSLGLPLAGLTTKTGFDEPILIYGGSSGMGSVAIQFARLSGSPNVIAVCSPRNFDFVKAIGAHAVFDYNDPECGAKIRAYTDDKLRYAFDCIATEQSAGIIDAALTSQPNVATVSSLLPVKHQRKDVTGKYTLGYTSFGDAFAKYGLDYPASAEDHAFASKFWRVSTDLIGSGKVKAHPPEVGTGGLQGVMEGMERMKAGKVSGTKLVYRIDESS